MIGFARFNNVEITSIVGVEILRTNAFLPAKRKLTIDAIARSDKSKVSSAFYNGRSIIIGVSITRNTRDLAEQSLDALLAILQATEKDLVLSQSGLVRRYTATYSDYNEVRSGGSYIELDLIFVCSDRFGYETNYTTILNANGRTLATYSDAFTFAGSAPWQQPYVMIFFTAVTGGTAATVRVGNNTNGQQVQITRTWLAGDRLEIDSFTKIVTVNGALVAYTGAIPEFAPRAGTLTYSDTLSTRTFNLTSYYYKRYV